MQQQEFLRQAMNQLDMSRDVFAQRIRCTRRVLDKWLLPDSSTDFRKMGKPIWNLIREITAHEILKLGSVKNIEKNRAKTS